MKRRLFSLALALALCAGLFTVPAAASGTPAITWLDIEEKPGYYISQLDWLSAKWGNGVINRSTEEPVSYDFAASAGEGLFCVGTGTNGPYGLVDGTGREILAPKYGTVEGGILFVDGLAVVRYNDKLGFIDKTGKEVIACKYDGASGFSEGLVAVRVGDYYITGKWGYIDKTGQEVTPLKYDGAGDFSEGLAVVRVGDYKTDEGIILGKSGYIDKTGREVIPLKYDGAKAFSEGLAAVNLNGKHGFIDKTGREVIPCKYSAGSSFSEGLAAVGRDGKRGYIDKTGKEVIPCKYDTTSSFSEGLAVVGLDDDEKSGNYNYSVVINESGEHFCRFGCIDKTGREVVPCKYDDIGKFCEGIAKVQLGDYKTAKYGFIDQTGREVIPCVYDDCVGGSDGWPGYVSNGLVCMGVNTGEIDGSGRPIRKYGFLDKTGREILPFVYDDAGFTCGAPNEQGTEYTYSPLCWVEKDGRYGYFMNPYMDIPDMAAPSTQNVTVDGKSVEFAMYALDGGATNYIRVRDLAAILKGTKARFEVGWNGSVTLTGKTAYTGATDQAPFHAPMPYTVCDEPTYVDGKAVDLEAILISYNGGGYTYYKLRDLAQALGFNVGWSAEKGVYVETNKPYDPAN